MMDVRAGDDHFSLNAHRSTYFDCGAVIFRSDGKHRFGENDRQDLAIVEAFELIGTNNYRQD